MNSKKNSIIDFSDVLGSLLRKVNRIDRNEKFCYGVTVSQCQIIEILHEHKTLSMNLLSDESGLAISTLTRIFDLLVRDEIVKRSRSEDDRRKVLVSLTEKGIELYMKLKLCSIDYTGEILNRIPAEKREEVIESLKLLDSAVDHKSRPCCRK